MRIRIFVILMVVVAVTAWVFLGPGGEPELVDVTDRSRVRQIPDSARLAEAPVRGDDPSKISIVTGRVTRDGEPTVATVEIVPASDDLDSPLSPRLTLRTTPDGTFEAPGLPPGGYWVFATTEDGACGWRRCQIPVPGVRVGVEVRLGTGRHEFRGHVRWRDGRPFRGLLLWPRPLDLSRTNGRFAFSGLEPGEARLLALAPGRLRVWSHAVTLPREEEYEFIVDEGLGSLTGRVLSMPGRTPVSGAVLSAMESSARGHHECQAKTDGEGRFSLDVRDGRVYLEMVAEGYQRTWRHVAAGTREVEILVISGTTLSGVVVRNDDGKPVPRITVTLSDGWCVIFPVTRSTRTDDDGRFTFPKAPCGLVAVFAGSDDWVPAAPWDRATMGKTDLQLTPGVPGVVELRVERAAWIKGRVVDERGDGIPGAHVVAAQDSRERATSTDAAGRFAVRGLFPHVEVALSAEAPGLARTEIGPLIPVAADSPPVEIRMPDPRWLDVTVLDAETGAPVAGAEVRAVGKRGNGKWPERWAGNRGITDADGKVRTGPLPDGPVGIRVFHDAYLDITPPRPAPEPDTPDSRRTMTVRLAPGGTISGRVLMPDGTPVADGRVEERNGSGGLSCGIEDGSFLMRGVPEGEHDLRATSYVGGRPLHGEARAVAGEKPVTITLVDEPGAADPGPVCLRLLDPTGKPLLWANVCAVQGRFFCVFFRVSFSAPGEVRAMESLWKDRDAAEGVRFLIFGARSEAGEPLGCILYGPVTRWDLPVDLRLSPEQAIRGRVLLADGRPAAGIHLTARMSTTRLGVWENDPGPAVSEARTDENGRFRLGGLGPGEYEIRITPAGDHTLPEPVLATAGASDIELTLRSATTR